MSTAHISIGSNLGDRAALIERAVAAISARFAVTAVSRPVESEPWGYSSPHPFINVGVNIEIGPGMTPETLLDILLEIQNSIDSSAHRNTDGSYADRAIDIDLICYGSVATPPDAHPALPHPRMHLREFVLIPMIEILPSWRHPLLGLTSARLLHRLSPSTP
ncbi:MAG TPA: 2-amino-4-hydroxy-6-hydroxymethyldihydropteridine diphosphokinase [Porphyromonadaceae bacterium]|nr:2-amino-4-hydroxy-6-hydroxymethyldihydropteridine diphosphokinase [Paramuribaculum sp.]HAB41078.1 2-amino-4-hydroxy-6-hydroxymethyldihydropteridine diphosphokinase [Porphyromonadaceae bacterium]